jgi:ABC-type multidrug transport system fused ATPase/permease subunit
VKKAPATGEEELIEQGRVSAAVLGAWLQAAGGGARVVPLMLVPMILVEVLQLGSSWWLTQWASAPAERNRFYLAGYAGWALAAALLTVVRHMIVLSVGLSAGSGMHDQLLISLLRAPVAFFDVTPIGRLLARFSRDLQTVDVALPSAVQTLGSTTFAVVSALAVVCANSPTFALTLPLLGWAYVSFSSFYMASSREMKRLESSTRAPMLTHVSETLDGLDTIRAYNAQPRFGRQAEFKIDRNVRAGLASAIANCWLGLRLELLGATLAAIAALLAFGRGPSLLQGAAAAATQASTRTSTGLCGENRKLNSTVAMPGMTLPAPVPAAMLEACQDVGGNTSSPASHTSPARSAITSAAPCRAFRAR